LRWWLVGVLALYSVVAGALYTSIVPVAELLQLMAIPALALGIVVLYNIFLQSTYRRLGNIALFNNAQLALDALVVTTLVYYSGGAVSWFWSMYSLLILEAAFIMPKRSHVWLMTLWCALLLGVVEFAEAAGVVAHQQVPFATISQSVGAFVAVRYLWQILVLSGTAWVSTHAIQAILPAGGRTCESLLDSATGLYARGYFQRAMTAEIGRARRDGRQVFCILLDIDHFAEFNRRFGIDTGDRLLAELAVAISLGVARAGDVLMTTNVAARWGGEEFAVLLAEDETVPNGIPTCDSAERLAEELRSVIGSVRVADAGVTVSVGLAAFPDDGSSPDDVLTAADEALVRAVEGGGNCVVVAVQAPEDEDSEQFADEG
jgi:diguanylate cyclase (GGDEF)-like protein